MKFHVQNWSLDTASRQLVCQGNVANLSTKAFDLLALLLRRAPEVVSKEQIRTVLWPNSFVVEQNIANLAAEVRSALNDDAASPRFLRTVHGIGYAFLATLRVDRPASHESAVAKRLPSVFWEHKRFQLAEGDNVLGRGLGVDAKIDHGAVSRRHARIVVGDGHAVVEDLGSRHGTYVETPKGFKRVVGRTRLASPSRLLLGPVQVTFEFKEDASTEDVLND